MRIRTERRSLDLGPGPGRIAVVADTHSKPHPNVPRLLEAEAPAAILHGGDIGNHQVIDALATIAPTHAVRGNIDNHAEDTPDVIVLDVTNVNAHVRILLVHIAVHGVRLRRDAKRLANEHGANLVVCGHSHVPLIARDGGFVVFNPGSIGPRRFTLPITYGVIELADGRMTMRHVNCETGEAWTPTPS